MSLAGASRSGFVSTGICSHDDDTGLFRQLSVQQTDDAFLNYAHDSHGTPTGTKMLLKRARSIIRRGLGNRQMRLSDKLVIQGLAALTPSVWFWCWHGNNHTGYREHYLWQTPAHLGDSSAADTPWLAASDNQIVGGTQARGASCAAGRPPNAML
jgi:hypothetical protein